MESDHIDVIIVREIVPVILLMKYPGTWYVRGTAINMAQLVCSVPPSFSCVLH